MGQLAPGAGRVVALSGYASAVGLLAIGSA